MSSNNTKKRDRQSQEGDCDELSSPSPLRRKLDGESEMDKAVKWHGKMKIDVVLQNEQFGWIWIMNTRSKFGFAKITDPEWGFMSLPDIISGDTPVERILEDELPCTFSQLTRRHPEFKSFFVR